MPRGLDDALLPYERMDLFLKEEEDIVVDVLRFAE